MGNLKFGVVLSARHVPAGGWESIRDIATECEELGYDSMWYGDHLVLGESRLECWTTLSALASVTKRIRLGALVLCNSFRSPSLLAKMAASLDVISGGRLEFGIGAGWNREEYEAYGFAFPKLRVRAEQLDEGLEIIKRMWTEDRPSYEGRYYRIKEASCEPKPLQKPHPPITVGGGEEKFILKIVASHADRWNWAYSVENYERKLKALREHCLQAGRKHEEIERSYLAYLVSIHRKEEDLVEFMRKVYQREGRVPATSSLPFEDWLKNVKDLGIVGTPEECLSRIRQYADIGVTYFMLRFVDLAERRESLRLFAEKVVDQI